MDMKGQIRMLIIGVVVTALVVGGGVYLMTKPVEKEVTETRITVTHYPTLLYHLPYSVAKVKGWFQEEGLEITDIVGSKGGGTTVRNITTGGIPFGEVATSAAVKSYLAGASIKIIAAGVQTPGSINWVSSKGSGIEDIQDLAGKTMTFTSPGSVTQSTSAMSLEEAAGIDPEDVERIAAGGTGEGLVMLKEGDVESAFNIEPVFSMKGGYDTWDVVFWARDYVPNYLQTVIITDTDWIEEHPSLLETVVKSRKRGVEWIKENPEEAATIFAESADIEKKYAAGGIEHADTDTYYSLGGFTLEGLRSVEEGMRIAGVIEPHVEVPWENIIDQRFLPTDMRIDLEEV